MEDCCPMPVVGLDIFVLERREKVKANALETITAPVEDSSHGLTEG